MFYFNTSGWATACVASREGEGREGKREEVEGRREEGRRVVGEWRGESKQEQYTRVTQLWVFTGARGIQEVQKHVR